VAVAGFKRDYYEDIDRDDFADYQAQQVVLIAAISVLIGLVAAAGPVVAFVAVVVLGVRWWVMSSMIARMGVALFPERPEDFTRKRAMRLVGYSTGPLFFAMLAAIPDFGIGPIIWVFLNVWSLAALVMGTRMMLGDVAIRDMTNILAVGAIPQLLILVAALSIRFWG
jgi:hypothetical protein